MAVMPKPFFFTTNPPALPERLAMAGVGHEVHENFVVVIFFYLCAFVVKFFCIFRFSILSCFRDKFIMFISIYPG
jgi:hypothetical protein